METQLPHLQSRSYKEFFYKLKRHIQYSKRLSKSPSKIMLSENEEGGGMSIISGGLGPGAASDIYHNCAAHSAQFVPQKDSFVNDKKGVVGYYSAHKAPPKSRRLRNRRLVVDPSSRFLH